MEKEVGIQEQEEFPLSKQWMEKELREELAKQDGLEEWNGVE